MRNQLTTSITLFVVLTLLTGGLYPAIVTLIAQAGFPEQANGSFLRDESGQLVGSRLIGQSFAEDRYFWSRLSATAPFPYNAGASSGSNLGPLNPSLKSNAEQRLAKLQKFGDQTGLVPVDLVTASASGLDPHISPAAADIQIARVAASRNLSEDSVRELVRVCTESRQLGILGEPRVNVLELNLALDRMSQD